MDLTRYDMHDNVKLEDRDGVFEVIDIENPSSNSPDYFVESEDGEIIHTKAGNMRKVTGLLPGSVNVDPDDEFFEEPTRTYEVLVVGKNTQSGISADKYVTVEADTPEEAKKKALDKAQSQVEETEVVYEETGIPEEILN